VRLSTGVAARKRSLRPLGLEAEGMLLVVEGAWRQYDNQIPKMSSFKVQGYQKYVVWREAKVKSKPT